MSQKHLIIGAGSAGLSALKVIRGISSKDEVKIITAETCLPYSPTSLPGIVMGRVKKSDIWLRDEEYFPDTQVTWAMGKQATQLVPEQKEVIYADGDVDQYDTLLIASGSEPVQPPIDGLEKVDFLSFHRLSDYYKLRSRLADAKEVTILGAGLVGMELASALCEAGYAVKVIEREASVLPLYLDETSGDYVKNIFLDRGIEVFTGKEIARVERQNVKTNLLCRDGDVFPSELLVVCAGVKPSISFLEGARIKTRDGITVDRKMKTNVDDIYAAGDCAEAPDFFSGQPGVNAIIPNAVAQGKIAGANMAGQDAEFKGWLPMNVVYFFGNSVFSIGLNSVKGSELEVLESKEETKRQLKRLLFKNDRLVGAVLINESAYPGAIRYLIENKLDVAKYKHLLFKKTKEISLWLMLETERKKSILSP